MKYLNIKTLIKFAIDKFAMMEKLEDAFLFFGCVRRIINFAVLEFKTLDKKIS